MVQCALCGCDQRERTGSEAPVGKRANVNMQAEGHSIALKNALKTGHLRIADMLLDNGAKFIELGTPK
jgi:hypothetical protein